jgi:hypothetical protein
MSIKETETLGHNWKMPHVIKEIETLGIIGRCIMSLKRLKRWGINRKMHHVD